MKFNKFKSNKKINFFFNFNMFAILVLIFLILLIFSVFIYFKSINNKNDTKIQKSLNYNLSSNISSYQRYIIEDKSKVEQEFSNRAVYVSDNKLLIGNSLKELENGYFDVKIKADNISGIYIYINKLYTSNFSDKLVYDKDYLTKIVSLMNQIFNFDLNQDQINCILYKIASNYIYLRKNYVENVDKLDQVIVDKFKIIMYIQKSVLVLKIEMV